MFWFKALKSILQVLQSEDSPMQIAVGAAMGCLAGFSPIGSLQAFLFFLVIMFFNINVGTAALTTALFAVLAFFLDPLAHKIGYALLVQSEGLVPLWTKLYNLPLIPFTRFNNTVVLGSLVIALAAFIPVLLGARWLVLYYRRQFKAKVDKWKIMKWLKVTNVVDMAVKVKK